MDVRSVNQLLILNAEAEQIKEGTYQISANWTVKYATPTEHLWMIILEAGEAVKTGLAQEECAGSIEIEQIKADAFYQLIISDTEKDYDKSKCQPVELLFAAYQNITGCYDGRQMQVKWEQPSAEVMSGQCVVKAVPKEKTPYYSQILSRYARCTDFLLDKQNFPENGAVQMTLIPYIKNISSGPITLSGLFFLLPPVITNVELAEEADGGSSITLEYSHFYEGDEWKEIKVHLKAEIRYEGRCVLHSELFADVKKIIWNLEHDEISIPLNKCEVILYLVQQGMCARITGRGNVLPLCAPVMEEVTVDTADTRLKWSYPEQLNTVFRIIAGAQTFVTAKREYFVKGTADVDTLYEVRAGAGPVSGKMSAFKQGFYQGCKGLCYCDSGKREAQITISFEKLFAVPLTEGLTEGPFSLDIKGNFTFQKDGTLTEEIFEKWLVLLEGKDITSQGYYAMRQCIARIADAGEEQMLYYYTGLSSRDRKADLSPGMFLVVEDGSFSPAYGGEENQGVVPGGSFTYGIDLDKNGKLSLNPYLRRLVQSWDADEETTAKKVSFTIGGELDFLREKMAKARISIWYPNSFQDSVKPPTAFFSDNIVLLADNSRVAVSKAIASLNADPSKSLEVTSTFFNGRGSVSLYHSVWIGQTWRMVPVGESLSSLCEKYLNYPLQKFTIRRWVAGQYVPIHYPLGDMVLLGGDRIEVN